VPQQSTGVSWHIYLRQQLKVVFDLISCIIYLYFAVVAAIKDACVVNIVAGGELGGAAN